MRKTILIFLLSLISWLAYAQEERVLHLSMNDGSTVIFMLKEKPQVTFSADSIKIVSATSEAKAKRSEVAEITFLFMETESGINDTDTDGTVDMNGEFIKVGNLAKESKVTIFTADGRVASTEKADDSGTATLSLTSLPKGIYLLNYNDTTIKFIRP